MARQATTMVPEDGDLVQMSDGRLGSVINADEEPGSGGPQFLEENGWQLSVEIDTTEESTEGEMTEMSSETEPDVTVRWDGGNNRWKEV